MSNIVKPFNQPKFKVKDYDSTQNYGKFVIEPLEQGFGQTIGNSFRRVLLSALPGASIFAISVDGAQHEFSALPGVVEDVTGITLNLKNLILKIDEQDSTHKRIELSVKGPAVVTGADLELPFGVEVVNPDLVIANLSEGGSLKMSIFARNSRGYVTSENNKPERAELGASVGIIATDSNYSPIVKVNYAVDNTRVGDDERYDRLTLEVWTNGSMLPQEAVALSARILMDHYSPFLELDQTTVDINIIKEKPEEEPDKFKDMKIEDLNISVRSYNCLKRAGIQTVSELVARSEDEVLKLKNLGKKSFKEIKDTLKNHGLTFRGTIE